MLYITPSEQVIFEEFTMSPLSLLNEIQGSVDSLKALKTLDQSAQYQSGE